MLLFLKKYPVEISRKFEQTLQEIKSQVRNEKGLDKEQREERILALYKETIFAYSSDYEVMMMEIENVGYDATGRTVKGNELPEAARQIRKFIMQKK